MRGEKNAIGEQCLGVEKAEEKLSYSLKTTGTEQTKHKATRRKGIIMMEEEMNERGDGKTKSTTPKSSLKTKLTNSYF